MNRPSGSFRSQPRSTILISFPRSGSSLARTLTSTPRHLTDLAGHDRLGGLPHGREDPLIVRWERGLLHTRRAVRDHHHRLSTHMPRHRSGLCSLMGELLAHPFRDLLSE